MKVRGPYEWRFSLESKYHTGLINYSSEKQTIMTDDDHDWRSAETVDIFGALSRPGRTKKYLTK